MPLEAPVTIASLPSSGRCPPLTPGLVDVVRDDVNPDIINPRWSSPSCSKTFRPILRTQGFESGGCKKVDAQSSRSMPNRRGELLQAISLVILPWVASIGEFVGSIGLIGMLNLL